jgi:hypothetical protein
MKPEARKRYGIPYAGASYEAAKSFAKTIVQDAHFVYGKGNAPEFMRSNAAGRAITG